MQGPGTGLLWQGEASLPSALEGLTAEFDMGSGVTPPLEAPGLCTQYINSADTYNYISEKHWAVMGMSHPLLPLVVPPKRNAVGYSDV